MARRSKNDLLTDRRYTDANSKPNAWRCMIKSVSVHGYRGLTSFDMTALGRINLLVGKNNSGKTSVLEALYLLAAAGDPFSLWSILQRRGERLDLDSTPERPSDTELDISHLFSGHESKIGARITITAKNSAPAKQISFSVQEATPKENPELFDAEVVDTQTPRVLLSVAGNPKPVVGMLPLSVRGGLRSEALDGARRLRRTPIANRMVRPPAHFISTESLTG